MAARSGADAIGLVFWPGSPRYVNLDTARRISLVLPPFVLRVGVFVDASREALAHAAEQAGLDLLQLHGAEPPESLAALPRRALKTVRVGAGFTPRDALRYEGRAAGLLLDTKSDSAPGGTGAVFDWTLARQVRERAAFLMLAGGLTAANVSAALAAVRPDAVDVSSGVEASPGRKDPGKVRAFIDAVKAV